jgi:transposase InsO family protein
MPWVGERVLGETVAGHLEQLFLRYGPPLVLKRDNGSNLNQQAVDALLARYLVIPLNSPPYYPPYNGGIECAIREMKTPLHKMILASGPIPESQVQSWAQMLASELNHNPRGCLEGQIACRVFQDTRSVRKAYTFRKRTKIFDCINDLTRALIRASAAHTQRQAEAARRLAVETWLQRNGVITITKNKKVLPISP